MDTGDFTFPATAAATSAPPEPGGPPACHLPFPKFASPVWLPPSPAAADDDAMASEEERPPREETAVVEAVGGGEAAAAGGEQTKEEDTMDLLWEDFNEELAALGPSPEESDAESEPPGRSSSLGCAPVLRPSARAGGAGHYRRRAGSWVLLMRIFRRLFVIDKTVAVPAAAGRHATTAAR
ncbi:hypothetical protein ACP70R_011842 [Stipagrostis hirtigluma subsp. patula]